MSGFCTARKTILTIKKIKIMNTQRTDTELLILKLNKQIECDTELVAVSKKVAEVLLKFNGKCYNIKVSKAITEILPKGIHVGNTLTDWEYSGGVRYAGLKLFSHNRCINDNSRGIYIDYNEVCVTIHVDANNRIDANKSIEIFNTVGVARLNDRINEIQASLLDLDAEAKHAKEIKQLIAEYNAKHSGYIRSIQINVQTIRY